MSNFKRADKINEIINYYVYELGKYSTPKWKSLSQEKKDSYTQELFAEIDKHIPNRYLENIDKSFLDVDNYFSMFGKDKTGLFIHGESGTGKTHYFYQMAILNILQQRTIRLWNFNDWVFKFRNIDLDRSLSALEKDDEWSYFFGGNVIMLDDIGAERITPWVSENLYRIVNYLYENKRKFIFTSNLSLGKLSVRFEDQITGERIASRLVEMSKLIKLSGNDKRLENDQTNTTSSVA